MEKTKGVDYEECRICNGSRKHFDHPCPHCMGYGVVHKNGRCLNGVEGDSHLASIGVHHDGSSEVTSTTRNRAKSSRFVSRAVASLSLAEREIFEGIDGDSEIYVSTLGASPLV